MCVDGRGRFVLWVKAGQALATPIVQSYVYFLIETVESYGDWTADGIVAVVVLPEDLVTEGNLPGSFYPI